MSSNPRIYFRIPLDSMAVDGLITYEQGQSLDYEVAVIIRSLVYKLLTTGLKENLIAF